MEKSEILQEIIKERRSVRTFSNEFLLREVMERIVEAGIYAPYGGATGIPLQQIRRIFVFTQGTENMERLKTIMLGQIRKNAGLLTTLVKFLPFMKNKLGAFANRINGLAKNGIPALNDAPYFIVVAEKRGFPPVEKQSAAHALENMWLTATAEGLGFQLISATGNLSGNGDFMKLLGLNEGKYHVEGCAVGYPNKTTSRKRTLELDKFVKWM